VRSRITSDYLGKQQSYRVYLPPCYDRQTDRRYPVVYLLHGAGHDDGYWDDVGVDEAADPLIAEGQIPPLLIVLPDGNRTFGSRTGDPPPFAGFLVQELIPHIDTAYRSQPDREHRAIGGISLGGAWALLLAARYPELFSAVGGHSPAIGTLNGIHPDVNALVAGKLRIYLDVGDQDSLKRPTAALDAALTQANDPHEFHVNPGSHVEVYWTSHLEEYLAFYTQPWQH
jgi:enterochelin esterase-like enzyme